MVGAAALVSLVLTVPAWAAGGSLTNHFSADTETFHGRARSSQADCRADRVVKVFQNTDSGRELQGMTRTNNAGAWSLHVMDAHGNYVAVAPAFEGMHGTCQRLASDPVDVM